MHLTSIRFENFRTIPDFELEVRENLVLVGPNDSGKSSILWGLNLLLGMSGQQILGAIAPDDFTDPKRDVLIEATLEEFSDTEQAAFADEISTESGTKTLRYRLEASISESDPTECSIQRSFPDSGFSRTATRDQLDAIGFEYVSANRSLRGELGATQTGVVRSLMRRVDLGEDLETIKQAIEGLTALLESADALAAFKSDLASALSATLPTDIAPEAIRFLIPGGLSETPLSDIQIGLESGGIIRPLDQQSDGVRALSAIAAYGIAHLGANTVAIDEPEMHLHPSAQKLVAHLLASSTAQSIIATHSSHVVASMSPAQIAVVHKAQPPKQVASGARETTFEFAARWWQDSFIQPLTARCILAVEGPSDRILVEAVAVALAIPLHRHGVHVFDLGSADQFPNAYSVFGPKGFGVRLLGLVDEDHRARWARTIGTEPADLEAEGFGVSNPDLEGELVNSLGCERVLDLLVGANVKSRAKVLAALGAATPTAITPEAMTAYLRDRKARAAVALARRIQRSDAEALTNMRDLLTRAIE